MCGEQNLLQMLVVLSYDWDDQKEPGEYEVQRKRLFWVPNRKAQTAGCAKNAWIKPLTKPIGGGPPQAP